MSDPFDAIAASDLSKAYLGVPALGPIDLVVPEGQRASIVGHNGSGKTTLLKILAGTLEPTAGAATVMGHAIGSSDARASVSFLSDQPVFYDDLSVWEHLEYVARMHRTDDWEEHAHHLVDVLGLGDRAVDLPTTFSRGLKQKAAIAIAFVRPFDVLLVDEPFVGLDRAGRDSLLGLIDWVHGDGATVVVATHELGTVGTSERLVALRDGEIAFDGRPDEADIASLVDGARTPPS